MALFVIQGAHSSLHSCLHLLVPEDVFPPDFQEEAPFASRFFPSSQPLRPQKLLIVLGRSPVASSRAFQSDNFGFKFQSYHLGAQ